MHHFQKIALCGALSFTATLPQDAFAHGGRRFEVQIIDNQLVAQGYITSGEDDGGGVVRPYHNAIHDHWTNFASNTGASATLPGFDVLNEADALIDSNLQWTLTGVFKWAPTDTELQPLAPTETIFISQGGTVASSVDLITPNANTSLQLLDAFNGANGDDLDLSYEYLSNPLDVPVGTIYVVASELSTSAAGVESSDTVYTLLSPDGNNHAERLHHASLHLESLLGTPVPEPATATIGVLSLIALRRRR